MLIVFFLSKSESISQTIPTFRGLKALGNAYKL